MKNSKHEIVITLGDPLGIGWEVTAKALEALKDSNYQFEIIGHKDHFKTYPQGQTIFDASHIQFTAIKDNNISENSCRAGAIALKCLEKAYEKIKNPNTQALVTAPLAKENIKKAGSDFPGHTEWLCHQYSVNQSAMMLFHSNLKIVLTTIHQPLKTIFKTITIESIKEKLALTLETMQNRFQIKNPKIAVCGINPHASENGLFGDEEKNIITPAIESFKKENASKNFILTGPHAPDTVFYEALKGKYDVVLCHYHDQGLIPIKTTGFDDAVNTTLGLPIIRTSPDHGTAFDIAGQSMASEKSMMAAIKAAGFFLKNQSD